MDQDAIDGFVERIYDLALEPDLWPELLARVAAIWGGHGAGLEQEHVESERGDGLTVGLDPSVVRTYFDYYAGRNVLRRFDGFGEIIASFTPDITADEECLPKSELMRTEFYNDFLRPVGIHSVMTLGLWAEGQSVTALSIYRPPGRPSFDQHEVDLAQSLQPHLVRAFRLARKLRGRLSGLAAGLDQSPFGVFVLSADGRVQHANRAAERLLAEPGGLSMLGGRLIAADVADNERLRGLVGRALAASARIGGGSAIRRPGRAPLSVVAVPYGADRFGGLHADRGAIVCVTDPEAATGLSEVYLREGIGLTGAEANIARALMAGRSLKRLAEELDVSLFTVKAHLRRIFEKAGVSRQAELVALLAREGRPQALSG